MVAVDKEGFEFRRGHSCRWSPELRFFEHVMVSNYNTKREDRGIVKKRDPAVMHYRTQDRQERGPERSTRVAWCERHGTLRTASGLPCTFSGRLGPRWAPPYGKLNWTLRPGPVDHGTSLLGWHETGCIVIKVSSQQEGVCRKRNAWKASPNQRETVILPPTGEENLAFGWTVIMTMIGT